MNLRRAAFIAAVAYLPSVGTPSWAQFESAPAQQQPCLKEFLRLRGDTEKKANAIRQASAHKAGAREACHLFEVFSVAEAKLIKYATENAAWCGVPPQVLVEMKKGHAKTTAIRIKVCRAAEAPPRPVGPTLSDALTAPIPDASNIRPGRGGTFDTLTGAPIGSK
jgi:hypothetical protein